MPFLRCDVYNENVKFSDFTKITMGFPSDGNFGRFQKDRSIHNVVKSTAILISDFVLFYKFFPASETVKKFPENKSSGGPFTFNGIHLAAS